MKTFLTLNLIASLFFATPAFADFDLLQKDQPAPYKGYLITLEREQDLRLMTKRLEIDEAQIQQYIKLGDTNAKTIDVLTQRVTLYQDETLRLGKEIVEARGDGFWNKFLYFALGVGASILTVYAVSGATK